MSHGTLYTERARNVAGVNRTVRNTVHSNQPNAACSDLKAKYKASTSRRERNPESPAIQGNTHTILGNNAEKKGK